MEIQEDTPEAYKKIWQAGPEKWVSSPDQLQMLQENSPIGSVQHANLLAAEEQLFGVSATQQPDAFIERHIEFLGQSREQLKTLLPEVQQKTVDLFATYFADGDSVTKEHLQTLFSSRLSSPDDVDVSDPFLRTSFGDFVGVTRRVRVNGLAFLKIAQGEVDMQEVLIDTLLTHEIIHSLLASALTTGAVGNKNFASDILSRNGIETTHTPSDEAVPANDLLISHTWVNEANIEDMRQRLTGSDITGYRLGVTILRTLKELDPTLGPQLEYTAFDGARPGELIGKLEQLVGPLGVEELGVVIGQEGAKEEGPDLDIVKGQLQALLQPEVRQQAMQAFDVHYNENENVADRLKLG